MALLAGLTMVAAVFGLFVAAVSGNAIPGRWAACALLAGSLAMWFAPVRYPDGISTLGDLAKRVAELNPMMLKAHGAGLRPGDIWLSLRTMAASESGMNANEIFPDTPLHSAGHGAQ